MRRTLADVSTEIGRIAGVSGLKTGSAQLTSMINLAVERMYPMVTDYPNTLHRLVFMQYDGIVALPSRYQSILKLDVEGTNGQSNRGHTPVVSQWYEFVGSGPGQQDKRPWAHAGIDRGTSPVFRQMIANPMTLRLFSYADERVGGVRPTVTVMGYDSNRAWIRTLNEGTGVWSDGIQLPLNGDMQVNWADSPILVSEVTDVILPVRNGIAELYWVDTLGNIFLTGRYDYWETTPAFRLYFFPEVQANPGRRCHALVRQAFRPVVNQTDSILIPSLPALRLAMKAIAKEDASDPTTAMAFWASAKQVLQDEAKQFYNGATRPVIDPVVTSEHAGSIPGVV